MMLETHGWVHGVAFYGSALAIQKRFRFNLADDYDFVKDCDFFSNNIGKISVLQVLNPPFNFNTDSAFISFKVVNNLFTGNNAGIYFEDLRSDHVDIEISNNTFANNLVFGFKNYNISTNYIYGRADQVHTRYTSKIENNSFVKNFLVDNISDTIVHSANFGIYGSEKLFNIGNNHWGSVTKDIITKGFKIPRDYGQEFFVYRQETDINGNKVSKKELFEGSQKRFIFWVEDVQK
jgi:hypothetical protein